MYHKGRFEMPLRDFIAVREIPEGDEIRVINPLCDDDGEIIKAELVYSGKAGDVSAENGDLLVDAINSDYGKNQSGYWHVELLPLYVSDVEAA